MTYDYIVVGAGAAGCVLANRLTADPAVTVLLVEEGGRGRHPLLAVPRAFFYTLRSDRYVRRYPTQTVQSSGATEAWIRGRGLGGSTLVNGMMYVRGAAADFDALESAGNPGWGAADFFRAYRAIEHDFLAISTPTGADALTEALFQAAACAGLNRTADFNDSDDERIGFTPAMISRGRRVSAASAFLAPARHRSNLTVLTGVRAERILLDGNRAAGVVVRRAGRRHELRARREVLVSAGTIETPLLLERSGIGNHDVLAAAAIAAVVDSPYVGERVIEHRGVSMQIRFRERVGPTERLNTLPKQVREAACYLATRKGPIATSGYDVVSAFRSSPELARPDVQGIWVPIAIDETSDRMRLAPYSGMLFTGYPLRPTTAGSVHVSTPDPEEPPVISPQYLEDEAERTATGAILDHAREVVASSPLGELVAEEVFPGLSVSTPDEVVRYAMQSGGGIYHAVGSCAMGPRPTDVVDARLRVRGVDGLRVVDASVLPFQVSGNSAAPVMALAWLAAEHVLDRP